MSSFLLERLLNEATQYGTGEILRQMPAAYTPEVERVIREGIRQAVQFYADGLDSLSRQQNPSDQGAKAEK